jgi:hypothetical protein
MTQAEALLGAYRDLTWEDYIEISDSIVKFDKNNINGELERQASIYSYYVGLLGTAKNDMDKAGLKLVQFMAETRKEQKENASGKYTAKDLDDYVMAHPDYFLLVETANDAQFKYSLIKGLVQSLDQKKDMLVQLSANSRAETNLYK